MSSKSGQNVLPNFDSVKDDDEEVLWTDKPKFVPYSITGLAAGFGILIFLAFYIAMTKSFNNDDGTTESFSILFVAILIALFVWPFYAKYFHTEIMIISDY